MGRVVASYKSLAAPDTALPTWLLTNKQVLSEATQQMARHGTWMVRLRSEYSAQRVGGGTSGVFLIEAAQALCKRLTMQSAEYEIGRAVNELSARWIDHYTMIFDETGRKMQ